MIDRWIAVGFLLFAFTTSSSVVVAQDLSLQKVVASPQNIAYSQAADEVIIDIRTPAEWQQTGVVEGAVPLEFFNSQGQYDAQAFIESVEALAPRGPRIGIICRTSSRSDSVSQLMAEQGWQVTDYQGGMVALSHHGYQTVPLTHALTALEGISYCETPLGAC